MADHFVADDSAVDVPEQTGALPPLVDVGPPLEGEQSLRWSRHLLLPQLGEDGQRRLRAARVCVVGAGGLGAPVLLYLAAAGVGRIGVVDDDLVELSNLQRQVVHGMADLGRDKVDSAADRVRALDPGVEVVTHRLRLDESTVELLADYDLVVDGSDTFETRYLVNDACVRLGLPDVWGSVLRFDAQVSVFWGSPPPGVPAVQLRDLFPEPPAADEVPSCAQAGVLGALCGQVGSVMATEAIKMITGVGRPLLGRVLVLDALAARWTEVPIGPADRSPEVPIGPADPVLRTSALEPRPERRDRQVSALRELTPADLAAALAGGTVTVVDVREAWEVRLGTIAGALHMPLEELLTGAALPDDSPLVLVCHLGVRSRRAGLALLARGFPDVAHLAGGLDAWSREIDPSVARY